MQDKVLVTYATRYGTTQEIAELIAATLRGGGVAIDIRPVQDVKTVEGYRAVLIGSAVNYGRWLPEAVDFVKTNCESLDRVPVALFTVHIKNLTDDKHCEKKRLAYLEDVRPLLRPLAEVYFAGRTNRRGLAELMPSWLARFMPTVDYVDPKKIRAWAWDLLPSLRVQE